jgi:hypothetical protein
MTDVRQTKCNGCGNVGPSYKWNQSAPAGWDWGSTSKIIFHLCDGCIPVFQVRAMDYKLLPERAANVALEKG